MSFLVSPFVVACLQCFYDRSIKGRTQKRVKEVSVFMRRFESCIKNLENQAKLEYDRVMNRMVFDNTVMTYSEEFSDIILPQKDPKCIPENSKILFFNQHVLFFL